ncbi:MAG: FAD-binding protein, partial [Muribaculaceae bacterium]|nr:FAD-binding protein [Muribaculaceae bacterium]
GHSARDIYSMLDNKGVDIQPKGLAVGVRLEHPQHLIDCIQYHSKNGRGDYLPAAEYSILTRVDGRGVYSFCMCPGGFIIPAASDKGQLVVNGMSPSNRGTKWANSGMVVEVLPEDIPEYDKYGNLKMMKFQEDIEAEFYANSNGSQNAPAQRMIDFVESKDSKSLPRTSYAPGIHPARIDKLLPSFIAYRLQKGFKDFGRKSKGFLTNEAVLIGDETRTSSPVRVPRNNDTLSHITVNHLFPCGEGAGYAGGIVSAAIDGERCAEAVASLVFGMNLGK